MNIRELELFRHLASTLHFGRTSQECNITPSGLTRTIQRLENEVGEPLFFRNNRSVHLTPAGMLFREYCEETLSNWHLFRSYLKSDTVLRGELTLYCSVTAILSILPQIFRKFRKAHPEVMIHVQTGDAAKALNKLKAREVDISIAALPDHQPEGLEFIELLKTPLLFIFPKFFPETIIYSEGTINWEKTPVILPADGLSRTRGEKWFADKGIHPYIYSQVSGNEAIIAMVSMGCGIGIVPRLVLEKSSLINEVDLLEISPRLKPFTVAACTLKKNKQNPLVQSFWNIVEIETAARFEQL
ncbi:MAG: HTH-type transcriptional activator IlvY [Desulfobulbaceae bacterium]|nr:HTH-type transcriptional activator IlvY [Desulfobulbaceae bacterium]